MSNQKTDGAGYFLYHSIGQYPGKAADMAGGFAEYSEAWGADNDAQWGYALGARGQYIDRWRGIIAAPEGTLTTCENVTSGLHMLMAALPSGHLKGKKVLVAGDCFPSLHFLLTGMADRFGFTLETVPMRQGATWVEDEDVIAAWGSDVGLALLTWVSSTSSHRINLEAMVAHGRAQGSIIGVDITQAAGLLAFDVSDPAIDFTVSTSLKWMCGTPGAGILHVAKPLLETCQPELRGWFSQENPFSWDLDKFAYAPDIRRFDNGTPSVVAAIGSLPALNWHAAQDKAAMLAHNRRLTGMILEGIDALGLPLATPRPEKDRGGSLMIRLPDHLNAAALVDDLRTQGIYTDARSQTFRVSPGNTTTQAGVQALLAGLTAFMASSGEH
jgi:kynureninase